MIAAPFLGEFGWEVSLWVPWLRWIMDNHYRGHTLTAFCKPGHEYLYEDFTEGTIGFEFKDTDKVTVDCQNAWVNGEKLSKADYIKLSMCSRKSDVLTPIDLHPSWHSNQPPQLGKKGAYFKYGTGTHDVGIAIHARACQTKQHHRNWPAYKWEKLVEELDTNVASIGHPTQALHVKGTEDLRGISLKALCDLIACSKVVIGPSSGPLALALLCATPVVWWSANSKDIPRYSIAWNPFKVPTICAAQNWDPDVDEVLVKL